jgi:hypothetical protein
LGEARDILNDYYHKIKSPKYDGPFDENKEIYVPMFKNPPVVLTNRSPSYKLIGRGERSSTVKKTRLEGTNDENIMRSILKSPNSVQFVNS